MKDEADKWFHIMFDENALSPGLSYTRTNRFDGFLTSTYEVKVATHALCFMVRGLKQKWKQPVSSYFTNVNKGQLI